MKWPGFERQSLADILREKPLFQFSKLHHEMTKEEIKQYFGADTHEEGEVRSIQILTCGRRTKDYRSFQTVQPFSFCFLIHHIAMRLKPIVGRRKDARKSCFEF